MIRCVLLVNSNLVVLSNLGMCDGCFQLGNVKVFPLKKLELYNIDICTDGTSAGDGQ